MSLAIRMTKHAKKTIQFTSFLENQTPVTRDTKTKITMEARMPIGITEGSNKGLPSFNGTPFGLTPTIGDINLIPQLQGINIQYDSGAMTTPKTIPIKLTIMEITVPNRSAKNNPIGMYANDVIHIVRLAITTMPADEMLFGKNNFNRTNKTTSSMDDSNV